MMTSWHGKMFRISGPLTTVDRPCEWSVMRTIDYFFDISMGELLNKESLCLWPAMMFMWGHSNCVYIIVFLENCLLHVLCLNIWHWGFKVTLSVYITGLLFHRKYLSFCLLFASLVTSVVICMILILRMTTAHACGVFTVKYPNV